MVIEELVARLGIKVGNLSDAKKFIKALDDIKKANKGLGQGLKLNFGGRSSGMGNTIRELERATAAMKRFRAEAMRTSKVRIGAGGAGGYGYQVPQGRGSGLARAVALGRGRSKFGSDAMAGAGSSLAGASPAYAGGRLVSASAKSSMNFERKMIEVSKATDAKGAELAAYGEQVMKLARDTGKNKEELAGILSAAGFAGRPKDELMRFTEFGAKASTAWGTGISDTGDALAQIGNIYKANQTQIEAIGDQINTMADKSASKEVDLLEILRRVGGSGKMAGMTSGDILGMGSALKGRGVQTEIASSGMESLINFLSTGEDFSGKADEGLKALGITSDKLKKNFASAPTKTMLEFLEKLGTITDPTKQTDIRTKIFGKERQDDIARMVDSSAEIRKNIEMINDRKNYGGSVRRQFSEQMDYDVSKIDQGNQQADILLKRLGDPVKRGMGYYATETNKEIDALSAAVKTFTEVVNMLRGKAPEGNPAEADNILRKMNGLLPLGTAAQQAQLEAAHDAAGPSATRALRFGGGLPSLTRQANGFPTIGYPQATNVGKGAGAGMTQPTFGGAFGLNGGQGKGASWANQGVKETTTQHITHMTDVGNDHRTQSVHIAQTVNGVPGVASAAAEGAKSGLASMGASIAKTNTTATTSGATPAP